MDLQSLISRHRAGVQAVSKRWLADITLFSRLVLKRPLRPYQLEVARAIVDSVLHQRGLTFVVMFPRQSGKNELQAHLEAYLLNLFQRVPSAQIVKASPTYKPQTINSLLRLETTLNNDWNRGRWQREQGYITRLGLARALFFSAEPSASVVGATATVLLEADEAQDISPDKWQKDFLPMAASANATRVLWGTAWTSQSLLAQERRAARALEMHDGLRRVFVVSPDQVIEANPPYGQFLEGQLARLGRQHPLVKTQYYLEEIDGAGGLFPPGRRALMLGTHARSRTPKPDTIYAFLLDVAGEDESSPSPLMGEREGVRDSTALTIVEVDLATLDDPILKAPTYRVADRYLWTGVKHPLLYGQIKSLADTWNARYLVADATGIGAGLVSFLARALYGRVIPFTFTSKSKSDLGWNFLGVVDSGRFKEYGQTQVSAPDPEQAAFFKQLEFCQYEILPGPGQTMRWAVPDGTRDPATGDLVHDDLLLSAALCSVLDEQPWAVSADTFIIRARDPLDDMSRGY